MSYEQLRATASTDFNIASDIIEAYGEPPKRMAPVLGSMVQAATLNRLGGVVAAAVLQHAEALQELARAIENHGRRVQDGLEFASRAFERARR